MPTMDPVSFLLVDDLEENFFLLRHYCAGTELPS